MKEIIIPLSKKKFTLVLFGAVCFVVSGVWLFQNADTVARYPPIFIFIEIIFIKIISVVCVIFFGLCGVYAFIKLFDNKPGLVINNDGIIDNSSYTSVGLIRWENITNVNTREFYGVKCLTIEVNNAEEILSKQTGLKKLLFDLHKGYIDSPVQISSTALKCDFQELYNTIKEQLTARHIV